MHLLARVFVINNRPNRHLQNNSLAVAPSFFRAFTMPPALSLVFRINPEMHQRIVPLARFHPDIASAPTIAARGPSPRNKLLPAECHAAIPAIPRLNPNFCLINKHGVSARVGTGALARPKERSSAKNAPTKKPPPQPRLNNSEAKKTVLKSRFSPRPPPCP